MPSIEQQAQPHLYDKLGFNIAKVPRGKDGHFIMIKETLNEEENKNIKIFHVYGLEKSTQLKYQCYQINIQI